MDIEALLRSGDLDAVAAALKDRVRKEPAKPAHRIFLFQLLVVMGDYERAMNQLNVLHDLDASALPMVQTYREAIRCESLRLEIFAGKRTPLVLGDPAPWMARVIQALSLDASGHAAEARRERLEAYESAETTGGSIDGVPFAWIADADSRIGPFFEAIIAGKYYWVPFSRLAKVSVEAPADLRDMVWAAAQLTLRNGGQTVALLPTRYPGTEAVKDHALRLSRRTEWIEKGEDTFHGLGQKTFATDVADYALLDVRTIELTADPAESPPAHG